MADVAMTRPRRRHEQVHRSLQRDGTSVVKDPSTEEYFHLGIEETFLLECLDGRRNAESICAAFQAHFGQPLALDEYQAFVELADEQGLLARGPTDDADEHQPGSTQRHHRRAQSFLYWQQPLFDPDRLFTWAAPRLWFFWTREFLFFSAVCIFAAMYIVATRPEDVATSFSAALHWQTIFFVWLTLLVVTTLHEFAHGLTCKHHGGDVREIGFLMMLLMPCFYCDVSDAWLFRQKSKRLWVTLAGGYFELWLWALAVFVWRLSSTDSLANYLAFVVVSVCGVQTLFNFNPFVKLDGYYLLSDWLEIPNLHQRAWEYFKHHVRRILWGEPPLEPPPRRSLLLAYGAASWLTSTAILGLMLVALFQLVHPRWPAASWALVTVASVVTIPALLQGTVAGELRQMVRTRQRRTLFWVVGLAAVVAGLCLARAPDRATGEFVVCPATCTHACAPVSGFIEAIHFHEGDRLVPGDVLARLEVPDLTSRLKQKDAQVREARAGLKLIEAGARLEERQRQRDCVERARLWRDLAQADLVRMRQSLAHQMVRLDGQIAQFQAGTNAAQDSYARAESIFKRGGGIAKEQLQEAQLRYQVAEAQLQQSQAEKAALKAEGALPAETELARREKDLAEAQATLELLEAGPRPEQLEVERARLARLEEEHHFLEQLRGRLDVISRVGGLITTAHLEDRVGQYVAEGACICVIEENGQLSAEISMAEQEATRVQAGQPVALKARGFPFQTFRARVERVAPRAVTGSSQSTITVYCRLDDSSSELRPGMSGHARVTLDHRPIGAIVVERLMRYLRTEFWW